jgi:hypothetical protein
VHVYTGFSISHKRLTSILSLLALHYIETNMNTLKTPVLFLMWDRHDSSMHLLNINKYELLLCALLRLRNVRQFIACNIFKINLVIKYCFKLDMGISNSNFWISTFSHFSSNNFLNIIPVNFGLKINKQL